MKKLTFTLLFALMAIVSAQAAKVYLKVAGFVTDNNTLTAYAWKAGTEDRLLGDWPGTKMALETIGADKYYVCEFDYDGEYSIIFKGTIYDKEQQSVDLTGNIGDCTFVANDNWTKEYKWSCDKTEGAPSAETPVETYTVKLGGNAYGAWSTQVTFTYNAETKEYVYEETEPAKLADDFKIDIPETKKWFKRDDLVNKNLSEASSDFVAMNDNSGDMKITDAANYSKITLTVKKEGETWKMKIVGEKKETPVETYTVQIKGVNYDNWGVNAPAFTYKAETGEYVYEETETAKLADMFKIYVKEGDRWISNASFKGALNNDLGYQDLNEGDVMNITDAADYSKITLTVKNDNGIWKLKVVGEKKDKVQIQGKFNEWKVVDMVSNPNGTYTYEVEANMAELSNGFGFMINGTYYAGDIVLDLDGDAVVLIGNPEYGKNLTLIAEGDVASVILTVAKDGDNWTVKATTGKTSSVAGVDAAGVVIAASNGEIVVDGAQSVAVYTTAGALVSTDARTRVAAGLYIVRADNVVKKVIVK